MTIKEIYQDCLDRAKYAERMENDSLTGRQVSQDYWKGVKMAMYDCSAMLEKTEEINPTKN